MKRPPGRPKLYPDRPPRKPSGLDKTQPAAGRCNAELKDRTEDGTILYCHAYPAGNGTRCRFHGGAHEARRFDFGPQDLYGRGWARHVPPRMMEVLSHALDEQDLLSLRAEIRLTDARVGELLQRIESGEIPQAWPKIEGAVTDLLGVLEASEPDLEWIRRITRRLKEAVELKVSDRDGWLEISEWMEMRRRLADTERRREEALQSYINSKQLITFMGLIQQAIVEEVQDTQVLSALTRRIRMLANRPELPRETRTAVEVDSYTLDEDDDHDGGQGGGFDSPVADGIDHDDLGPDEPGGDGLGDHEPGSAGGLGDGPGAAEVPGEPGPGLGGGGTGSGEGDPRPGTDRVPGVGGPGEGQLIL